MSEPSEDGELAAKLEILEEDIASLGKVVVAFSGGVDSALLAVVAAGVLGDGALAVTAVSPSLATGERRAARSFAVERGIAHVEVATDELERPEYRRNAGDRCYHCKSAMFDVLAPLAAAMEARIALGTNLDDLAAPHRPGLRAAERYGVAAPLVAAGLTKSDVRALSRQLNLRTADKPAAACLASRVAYKDPVTAEILARIELAENALHGFGFEVCRVRAHANGSVARVEVPESEIERAARRAAELDAAIRAAGFEFCALDLGGFESGRMNVLLGLPMAGGHR